MTLRLAAASPSAAPARALAHICNSRLQGHCKHACRVATAWRAGGRLVSIGHPTRQPHLPQQELHGQCMHRLVQGIVHAWVAELHSRCTGAIVGDAWTQTACSKSEMHAPWSVVQMELSCCDAFPLIYTHTHTSTHPQQHTHARHHPLNPARQYTCSVQQQGCTPRRRALRLTRCAKSMASSSLAPPVSSFEAPSPPPAWPLPQGCSAQLALAVQVFAADERAAPSPAGCSAQLALAAQVSDAAEPAAASPLGCTAQLALAAHVSDANEPAAASPSGSRALLAVAVQVSAAVELAATPPVGRLAGAGPGPVPGEAALQRSRPARSHPTLVRHFPTPSRPHSELVTQVAASPPPLLSHHHHITRLDCCGLPSRCRSLSAAVTSAFSMGRRMCTHSSSGQGWLQNCSRGGTGS